MLSETERVTTLTYLLLYMGAFLVQIVTQGYISHLLGADRPTEAMINLILEIKLQFQISKCWLFDVT